MQFLFRLGFYHEQSRLDRDDYMDILWNNIEKGITTDIHPEDSRKTIFGNSHYVEQTKIRGFSVAYLLVLRQIKEICRTERNFYVPILSLIVDKLYETSNKIK